MPKTFSHLDRLLGTELTDTLSSIPNAEAAVADCLEWNRQAFDKWLKTHGLSKKQHVQKHFKELLGNAEKQLGHLHGWGDLTRKRDLERAIGFLSLHTPPQRSGVYLKSDSAFHFLITHPPANLIQAMGVRSAEDMFYTFMPLDVIAMTRHTESREWQDAHLSELAKLDASHFETRPIRFLVLDRKFLESAAAASEHSLKPWSASHNKEVGTLIFYTFDPADHIVTPKLLLTMLFFHYYFETLRAAHLARGYEEHPKERTGERFAFIIRSTRRTFSFHNPNVHSEALHWEDAIAYISAIFPAIAFKEYLAYLPCGEFMDEAAEPVSLNIIDQLWDINLSTGSSYFGHKEQTFLHHFRETFWSEILQTLRRLSKSEMRSAVFHQLELDDLAFTQQMLDGD